MAQYRTDLPGWYFSAMNNRWGAGSPKKGKGKKNGNFKPLQIGQSGSQYASSPASGQGKGLLIQDKSEPGTSLGQETPTFPQEEQVNNPKVEGVRTAKNLGKKRRGFRRGGGGGSGLKIGSLNI